MTERFTDKVAIVTGAARGIGAAIAQRLAGEGARVVLADRDGAAAEATAQGLVARDWQAAGLACDVSDEAQVEGCVGETLARFGRLDVIVNNAGLMTFKGLGDWTSADWMKVLQVDLIGAAMFTREAFRHMGDSGGSIVNVSSIHAMQTSPDAAPYSAAKAGMLSLTRTTSIEGDERGIRANAVLPGAVDTPMLWDNPNVKSGAETIDERNVGKPEDIAAAVAFLASEDARFITGASLVVDGGRLAKL
jgi:NAD(P)-dependent dehydrogenase (short-subunit alcohol dehydrogenase family)